MSMLSANTTVDAMLILYMCVKIHTLHRYLEMSLRLVAGLLNLRQDFKPRLDPVDQSLRKVTLGVILDL